MPVFTSTSVSVPNFIPLENPTSFRRTMYASEINKCILNYCKEALPIRIESIEEFLKKSITLIKSQRHWNHVNIITIFHRLAKLVNDSDLDSSTLYSSDDLRLLIKLIDKNMHDFEPRHIENAFWAWSVIQYPEEDTYNRLLDYCQRDKSLMTAQQLVTICDAASHFRNLPENFFEDLVCEIIRKRHDLKLEDYSIFLSSLDYAHYKDVTLLQDIAEGCLGLMSVRPNYLDTVDVISKIAYSFALTDFYNKKLFTKISQHFKEVIRSEPNDAISLRSLSRFVFAIYTIDHKDADMLNAIGEFICENKRALSPSECSQFFKLYAKFEWYSEKTISTLFSAALDCINDFKAYELLPIFTFCDSVRYLDKELLKPFIEHFCKDDRPQQRNNFSTDCAIIMKALASLGLKNNDLLEYVLTHFPITKTLYKPADLVSLFYAFAVFDEKYRQNSYIA